MGGESNSDGRVPERSLGHAKRKEVLKRFAASGLRKRGLPATTVIRSRLARSENQRSENGFSATIHVQMRPLRRAIGDSD